MCLNDLFIYQSEGQMGDKPSESLKINPQIIERIEPSSLIPVQQIQTLNQSLQIQYVRNNIRRQSIAAQSDSSLASSIFQ